MADTTLLKDNLVGSVPTEVSNELIKSIVKQSTAFTVCRHVPMTSDKKILPVLTDTGSAYWTGEGEKIGTSVMAFDYPQLTAQKLAVIIPTTKEKLSDSALNVLGEIKEGIADAFTRAIDSAVFFGNASPFTKNIVDVAEGNKIVGTGKIDMDISGAMGKVEDSDYTVNSIITHNGMKKVFRELRDSNNNAIVLPGGASGTQIYNTTIHIPQSRAWDKTKAEVLLGDFTKAIIGTRENIEYEILKEATIGELNLAEQDLIAVKCTMRFGFNIVDNKAFSKVTPKV
ncbi:phage major capsid protein [Oceanirhabdus sp. W0125-5]|uniref:phage major capsid protein n=1 Tax=Oceanirhabdus sp. W0125-5 TaxID=2999116 RepID=UPI0022F31AE8|nr:phage major capsid protein [Oceanirhabdus sp. W0125-5]WBW97585.1 phage major capsid protein [Oceanirhabdus sp. W0125-5]